MGAAKIMHGLSGTPAYNSWMRMNQRCNDPNKDSYHHYGGRGIKVCDRWQGIEGAINFVKDMGERPEGMTLDRIDNNSDYSPSNCRWATKEQQANNKRSNRMITYKGRTKSLSQWAREVGLTPKALNLRINTHKWEVDRALTQPMRKRMCNLECCQYTEEETLAYFYEKYLERV